EDGIRDFHVTGVQTCALPIFASPYGTRVLLADVQGTGLPAIGTAFAVLGAFREAAIREPELTGVVAALEDATLRHNAFSRRVGEPERFVTALVLDVGGDRTALAVNCGHPPPLLLDPDRVRPALRHDPEVPLGLGALAARPRAVEEFDFPRRRDPAAVHRRPHRGQGRLRPVLPSARASGRPASSALRAAGP